MTDQHMPALYMGRLHYATTCVADQPCDNFMAAGSDAARDARPISDTRGSADYRRSLVEVLTARALARAAATLGFAIEVP